MRTKKDAHGNDAKNLKNNGKSTAIDQQIDQFAGIIISILLKQLYETKSVSDSPRNDTEKKHG
jgi:hypothetical protein